MIDNQLFEACKLYNCALQERNEVYRISKNSINYYYQAKQLKGLREEGLLNLPNFSCCQDILRRVDRAFASFFNRIRRGEKPGFPRYKSSKRFDTITFPRYGSGCKVIDNRMRIQGIGKIKVKWHRKIEGNIKNVSLKREIDKYYIIFCVETQGNIMPESNNSIGIDVGIENFATFSNGTFTKNPKFFIKSQKKLRRMQRSVSRKDKKSNRRKNAMVLCAKLEKIIFNKRQDFLHNQSREIIDNNGIVCIEDLKIKNLSTGTFAKSIHDVGWGYFMNMLAYKAEDAGRTLIKVNPSGTSQRCNKCGTIVKKKLSDRWHLCNVCGESVHRDINSAKEILRLGLSHHAVTRNNSSSVACKAV